MTDRRVYVEYGLARRRVHEIKIEWITGTALYQDLMGRILNYGNIVISTSGQYAGSVVMADVSDPMHIRTMLEDILRKYKEQARVKEKIRDLEKEYEFGRITEELYQKLKKKYEEELKSFL